jgi:hypothetical protein
MSAGCNRHTQNNSLVVDLYEEEEEEDPDDH